MNTGLILRKLFSAYALGDRDEFLRIGEEIIEEEERRNNKSLADDLRNILYSKYIENNNHNSSIKIPYNKEYGIPLIEIKKFNRDWSDIIIDETIKKRLENVIQENIMRSVLKSYSLSPPQKILIYGPQGCGKTLAVEVISSLLIYPMVYIKLDGLISQNISKTAVNLKKIFDFVHVGEWVVYLDSFDVFTKEIEKSSCCGCIKALNTIFFQLLDNYHGDSLIVAAIDNHELLDKSLRLKFDEIIFLGLPDSKKIAEIFKKQVRSFKTHYIDYDKLALQSCGLTPADIEIICKNAIKDAIITKRELIDQSDMESSIAEYKDELNRIYK